MPRAPGRSQHHTSDGVSRSRWGQSVRGRSCRTATRSVVEAHQVLQGRRLGEGVLVAPRNIWQDDAVRDGVPVRGGALVRAVCVCLTRASGRRARADGPRTIAARARSRRRPWSRSCRPGWCRRPPRAACDGSARSPPGGTGSVHARTSAHPPRTRRRRHPRAPSRSRGCPCCPAPGPRRRRPRGKARLGGCPGRCMRRARSVSTTVRPSLVAVTRRRNGSMYDTFSGMGAVKRPAGLALSGPRPVVRLTVRSGRPWDPSRRSEAVAPWHRR